MIYRRLYNWPSFGWRSSYDELDQMRRSMDRLLGQLSGESALGRSVGVFPLINLSETKEAYHVRAELPGIKSGDLDIQATGKTVSISGERKINPEKDNVRYHRREREGGKFSRIISLPGEIDANKVEARLVNGILKLVIAKAEEAKPRQITIK